MWARYTIVVNYGVNYGCMVINDEFGYNNSVLKVHLDRHQLGFSWYYVIQVNC